MLLLLALYSNWDARWQCRAGMRWRLYTERHDVPVSNLILQETTLFQCFFSAFIYFVHSGPRLTAAPRIPRLRDYSFTGIWGEPGLPFEWMLKVERKASSSSQLLCMKCGKHVIVSIGICLTPMDSLVPDHRNNLRRSKRRRIVLGVETLDPGSTGE